MSYKDPNHLQQMGKANKSVKNEDPFVFLDIVTGHNFSQQYLDNDVGHQIELKSCD